MPCWNSWRSTVKRIPLIADSHYGYWRDFLALDTTPEEDAACLRLEAMGQEFLVDFGYRNAVEKVKALCTTPLS